MKQHINDNVTLLKVFRTLLIFKHSKPLTIHEKEKKK